MSDHSFDFAFHTGATLRTLYATDASEYRELPAAVAFPERPEHIRELILHAVGTGQGLIPRGAGTSLAGQVVGDGIVVDAGRHLNRILEIDTARRTVRVEPGVVRNELNAALRPQGLIFGPETSTANRAMIGGMVGNNSCGSNSLVYGSTPPSTDLPCKGYLSRRLGPDIRPTDAELRRQVRGATAWRLGLPTCARSPPGDPRDRGALILCLYRFPSEASPAQYRPYCAIEPTDGRPRVFSRSRPALANLCKLNRTATEATSPFFGTEFELLLSIRSQSRARTGALAPERPLPKTERPSA